MLKLNASLSSDWFRNDTIKQKGLNMATSDCNFLSVVKDIKVNIYQDVLQKHTEIIDAHKEILSMYHDIVQMKEEIDKKYEHMVLIERKLDAFNLGYIPCDSADSICDPTTGSC